MSPTSERCRGKLDFDVLVAWSFQARSRGATFPQSAEDRLPTSFVVFPDSPLADVEQSVSELLRSDLRQQRLSGLFPRPISTSKTTSFPPSNTVLGIALRVTLMSLVGMVLGGLFGWGAGSLVPTWFG